MTIDNTRKIDDILCEFCRLFPYLRLDFFFTPYRPYNENAKKVLPVTGKTLEEVRTVRKDAIIHIHPEMTVAELEDQFKTIYGLGVQVTRKSGKMWLETTLTDNWTLVEQNKQGEELSHKRSDL